jgi:hypothetical protein
MVTTLLPVGKSLSAAVVGTLGLVLLATPAVAEVCLTPVFPTPILGCPSIVDYLVQNDQASGRTVAVADFNRDGKLDVVVAEDGSKDFELAVLLGNGDGTFQAPINIYPGAACCNPDLRGATWAIVGDFNSDGKPDIAAANFNGYVTILLGNGDGSFTLSPLLRPTGCCTGPTAGAAGDFNGDGKLDLVVTATSTSPGTAIVYLGNGDGTFRLNPTAVTVGTTSNSPASIAVGDFNHDGKLDFATANSSNYFNGSTSIVLGKGDGTFQPAVDYQDTGGLTPTSIVAADFNHDSFLDLAMLDRGNGQVAIFINQGNGTFQSPTYYNAGVTGNRQQSSMELAVGDFNRDNNPDLVVIANQESTAGVLLGNGNGTFRPGAWYIVDVDANGVAVGDFNGDGNLDFVVSAVTANTLTVVLGNGDGTFKSARSYVPYTIRQFLPNTFGPSPTSVAFGDFNGDGSADMAVVDQGNSNVTIFLNNGDGTFAESTNYSTGPTAGTMVSVADFNHDGRLDLVVGLNSGGGSVNSFTILLGNGDGTFQSAVAYPNGSNGGVSALAIVDVNGDGLPDVISNSEQISVNGNLYVTLGKGDGTFQPGVQTPPACSSGLNTGAGYFAAADLNGDHKPDLAVACGGDSVVSVLLNNGNGTFGSATSFPTLAGPSSIAIGDFNEDGKPDLAVTDYGDSKHVSVLLGNGNGMFSAQTPYSVLGAPYLQSVFNFNTFNPPGVNTAYVVAADFNLDGHLDLLVGDNTAIIGVCCNPVETVNNGVQLFLGNGDGTFQSDNSYLAGRQGTFLAVADLDNNGSPDGAVVSSSDSSVNILLNRGSKIQPGALVVVKKTVGGDGTFNFTGTGSGLPASFQITTRGNTGSYPAITNLAPGSGYSISEPAQTGWVLTTAICSSGTPSNIFIANGQTTTCTFTNTQHAPTLTVNRMKLNFGYGNALITSPQAVTVSISGGFGVAWTASSDHPNVTVSPTSGNGSGTFQVTATPPPGGGTSGAIITVTASGATGSPQQIQVNVASVAPTMPFGSFDTPANNTIVAAGSIAVTGWALDSIEVVSVGIWREPIPNEPTASNGLVFIGNANFVADARLDVAAAFPRSPYQYRGGWGYLMLSNFLPNSSGAPGRGNGTYKLHVIVTNKSGTAIDLGTRTITVDNAHATKPFGTLDTPDQGGTASGNAFVNFGWALTQNPYFIPFDGSTINVFVDSLPIGHPTYNQPRADIESLFPGYANTNGAVGFFFMDTTKLKNGVHTISWSVADNAGRIDGIGSRYFAVLNANGGGVAPPAEESPTPESLTEPVQLRSGYDVNAPAVALVPDADGSYSIEMDQLGRIELSIGASKGQLMVNHEAADLPLGSTLQAGVFYWQSPVGFLGKYELVFERLDGTQTRVQVKIVPKRYYLQ